MYANNSFLGESYGPSGISSAWTGDGSQSAYTASPVVIGIRPLITASTGTSGTSSVSTGTATASPCSGAQKSGAMVQSGAGRDYVRDLRRESISGRFKNPWKEFLSAYFDDTPVKMNQIRGSCDKGILSESTAFRERRCSSQDGLHCQMDSRLFNWTDFVTPSYWGSRTVGSPIGEVQSSRTFALF